MLKRLGSFGAKRKAKMGSIPYPTLEYVAPPTLDQVPTDLVSTWNVSHHSESSVDAEEEECSICLDSLSNSGSVAIKSCSHAFHSKCLEDSFKRERKCPVCRNDMPARNVSPSGTLKVEQIRARCPGFQPASTTSILLTYDIPNGTQLPYHDSPGQYYRGSTRVAYLPDNEDGRELLVRLQYAFMSGLTFRIGTSATTGRSNVVTWTTSFDHKTSLTGGPFGFPDPGYIFTTHRKLSDIGIPDVQTCATKLQELLTSMPAASNGTNGVSNWTPPAVTQTETIRYDAPRSICQANSMLTPDVVETLPLVALTEDHCPICFDVLSSELSIKIKRCNHSFHQECIKRCFSSEAKCPVCRIQVGRLQGKSPSATMTIEPPQSAGTGSHYSQERICPGFVPQCHAIEINYNIPSGRQASYHDHPSATYSGTRRTAYLPNNFEGLCVLLRLKYAFRHG